jgi:anhydro-N-acetylmuramic acid kinase
MPTDHFKSMDSKNNSKKDVYKVLGLMSGTSLDGLDLAYCTFKRTDAGWTFSIVQAETLKYTSPWQKKLKAAHQLSGEALVALDVEYGHFLGQACRTFLSKHKVNIDFIASHGHTVFHQPDKGFTLQIGNGQALYTSAEKPVIYDFRSLDVLYGGQGAPLVPVGDKHLFHEYDVCLNLGGIANLSLDVKGKRLAWDAAFVNMGLNYLAGKAGKGYDAGGAMAAEGELHTGLLKSLTKAYEPLRAKKPSLGREIFEKKFRPLLDKDTIALHDRLHTFTVAAAREVGDAILGSVGNRAASVLCTGGGAFNHFFMSCLLEHCGDQISLILPDETVIKFKEALVFAFLGVLRSRNEVNCLKSVTLASRDSSSGLTVGLV